MAVLLLTTLAIVAGDLALKLLLRRVAGTAAMPLGPFGRVQLSNGRLWLQHWRSPLRAMILWMLWIASAVLLMAGSLWLALSPLFAGLLLGGSLSNAVEHSYRGAISDYVCLHYWPSFNLADTAITIGAAGIMIEALLRIAA